MAKGYPAEDPTALQDKKHEDILCYAEYDMWYAEVYLNIRINRGGNL